ncbi:unnamed protein product [Arctogadus glacialis]
MDTESPLLSFIKSSLPKMRDPEPFLERLQGLGVEDLEDLTYLQESDLLSVLRPIEARKLLSLLQKTSMPTRCLGQSSKQPEQPTVQQSQYQYKSSITV